MRRTLILLAKRPDRQLPARIAAGEEPRTEYLELARATGADLLDFHDADSSLLARLGPGPSWSLATLGLWRRRAYDNLYATGEDIGIPMAILLKSVGTRGKLTVVMHNVDTPKRRAVLKLLGHGVYRAIIVLGQSQRDILVNECGMPPSKVHVLDQWCDTRFYRPSNQTGPLGDYVLSVGMESRDYPTLQRAAQGMPLRFEVIASGWSPGAGYGPAAGISAENNISVNRGLSSKALRDLYAGARFVVVPLKQVTYAAGVSAIVEGMAMGKAVVASRSQGIGDYVKDGVSGKLVPVGDAEALRSAIAKLWNNPALADRMGQHNRAWVERDLNTDRYVERAANLLGAARARRSPGEPVPEVAG
jgi:glycosyltransferase involved in cell wall biosynthesis